MGSLEDDPSTRFATVGRAKEVASVRLDDPARLALVVSWPRDDPPRTPEELPPPLVGLARSEDGGRLWKVVSTWEGPRSTDLNRRHEITLDVR